MATSYLRQEQFRDLPLAICGVCDQKISFEMIEKLERGDEIELAARSTAEVANKDMTDKERVGAANEKR